MSGQIKLLLLDHKNAEAKMLSIVSTPEYDKLRNNLSEDDFCELCWHLHNKGAYTNLNSALWIQDAFKSLNVAYHGWGY